MVNGATAHALDFDDTNESIRGHLGTTLWPTILALAEDTGASGKAMIEAYVVGVRAAVAVADGMAIDSHYGKGWHSTSTIGVLAATCAASRLAGLGVDRTRNALGIAGSMAGGSRQNFGTLTKPFHAGLAARNAVLAARLAQAGLDAGQTMLEGPLGYYALFEGRRRVPQLAASLRQPWTSSRHGVSLKRHALCYNLQRICEAVLSICEDGAVSPDNVVRVDATIEPEGKAPFIRHRPTTGLECKFSAHYAVAALIAGRGLGPMDFDDAILDHEAVNALMCRIEVHESDIPPVGEREWIEGFAVVSIELKTGEKLCRRVDTPKGHWGAPFTRQELSDKFAGCVALGFPGCDSARLEQAIWSIDTMDRFSGFGDVEGR
jgi:2-methylcitrate dehydratase PrpD